MTVYCLTGDLGSGKTLCSVGRIRDYAERGRPIATNLDLYLEHLLPRHSKLVITRLPDYPKSVDLWALGKGNSTPDESRNGLLVLDELGASMNSRQWSDKDRQEVIKFLLHTRKLGWDVILIIQHVDMLDKQIRNALVEHLVVCRRLDRVKVPFLGSLLQLAGFSGKFFKFHIAFVHYGRLSTSPQVDRWWYWGVPLYKSYDTRQAFSEDRTGTASLLSSWHIHRTIPDESFLTSLREGARLCLVAFLFVCVKLRFFRFEDVFEPVQG